MLAIESIANGTTNDSISTDLCITSIEMIDNSSIRVWFSKPIVNGDITTNFTLTGLVNKSVIMTQYEIEDINGVDTDSRRGIRLYFESDFIPGQWTLTINSFIGNDNSILSTLGDETSLNGTPTIIFDLIDRSETNSDIIESNTCGKYIPKIIRKKKNFSAIIDAIDSGDISIQNQLRDTFDQMFLTSSTDNFLTTRAHDIGIDRPYKVGMPDEDFRKLTTNVVNEKLTFNSILNILESVYGQDSVSAYIESIKKEPYEIYNNGTLDILIDGKDQVHFVAETENFTIPLRATALEVASFLNYFFIKNDIKAFALAKNYKLRIYSKTRGNRSSISINGGSLQPSLQLGNPIGTFGPITIESNTWTLSNPRTGIVRFTENIPFLNITPIKIGDYVTIIGSEFPEVLRGDHEIVGINYYYSGFLPIYWFEIESDFIVPINTIQNLSISTTEGNSKGGYNVAFGWTNPTVLSPLTQLRLVIKKDTIPTNYNDSAYLIEDMPGGGYDFNSTSGASQSITRTVSGKGNWTVCIMFIESTGTVQEQLVYGKNLAAFNIV
jgi:hypothetical protein